MSTTKRKSVVAQVRMLVDLLLGDPLLVVQTDYELRDLPATSTLLPRGVEYTGRVTLTLMGTPHPYKGKNPHAAALGRRGGAVKSDAKTKAARKNAKKGGWPKGRKRKP